MQKTIGVTATHSSLRSRLANASNGRLILLALGLLMSVALSVSLVRFLQPVLAPVPQLLTDPFLQLPTADSVRVVWFTEFAGSRHWVEYGDRFDQQAVAVTTKLSRMREDQRSRVGAQSGD